MRPTMRRLTLWVVLLGFVLQGTGLVAAFPSCANKAAACASSSKSCDEAGSECCCCKPSAPPSQMQQAAAPAQSELAVPLMAVVIEVVSRPSGGYVPQQVASPRLPELRRVGRGRAPPAVSVSLS